MAASDAEFPGECFSYVRVPLSHSTRCFTLPEYGGLIAIVDEER